MLIATETTAATAGLNPWYTALGSFAGLLLAAFIAGGVKLYADGRQRRVESQTNALYGLQEAALDYRSYLTVHGALLSEKQSRKYAVLEGRLAVARVRVGCEQVRYVVPRWREAADLFWTGSDEGDLQEEDRLWELLHEKIGQELRRYDA